MAAKHTPTPWTAGNSAIFAGNKCIGVTDCDSVSRNIEAANAAFIVRAVNNHEALMTFAQKVINVSAGGKDTVSLLVSLHDLAVEALKVVSDAEAL